MIRLFREISTFNGGITTAPNWHYIKERYKEVIDKIVNYYRTRAYNVRSDHMLVGMLYQILPSLDKENVRFVNLCNARAPYIANNYGLSSAINYGRVHHGVFYSKEDDEILLFDETDFNVQYSAFNWKNLCPVRILKHHITNLGLMLANGKDTNTEKGLAVLSINISMLAFMYKCFVSRSIEGDNISYARFIHSYVLPNMLYEHFDHVLMNRMIALYNDIDIGEATARHAITFNHMDNEIDKILYFIIKHLKSRTMKYDTCLKNICSLSKTDMQEFLVLPSYVPTRQQEWTHVLTRLEVFNFLMDIGGIKGIRYNRDNITEFGRELKYIGNDKANFVKGLSKDSEDKLQRYVDHVMYHC